MFASVCNHLRPFVRSAPRTLLVFLALLAAVSPRAALAHHSFAMYDSTKLVTVDGTVTNFQWTNPHVLLWVTGSTAAGDAPTLWTVELPTSPGNLGRMGWSKHSLKAGDHVVVELNPLRDGKHGGSFKKATITATGKVLLANPVSKGADGGASYGPDEAKKDADAKPKSKWSCSLGAAGANPVWPVFALSLGVLLVARRRRSAACH
jgi:MYXO-CTERM domain-containing protein